MNTLPQIVKQTHLTYYWYYRDTSGEPYALVTRHDITDKKWYHQYQVTDGQWTEGTPTPLPIFGLHLLQNHNSKENIYIFEGERCAEAAHHLGLTALTSMMGAHNAEKADWTALARYREHQNFILVPDNDEPGRTYMKSVYGEICRVLPEAVVKVCSLDLQDKGDDLIDWLQSQSTCPSDWDGFKPFDASASIHLKNAFLKIVDSGAIPAEKFFCEVEKPTFIGPFEPIKDNVFPVKKCPITGFPDVIQLWIKTRAEQMQVPIDYLAAPLLVYTGSIIGKKRGIKVRPGTDWIEFPNLWGMVIGRPSLMKSPAMQAMQKPLTHLINQANLRHDDAHDQHVRLHDKWKILKKAQEDQFKKEIEKKLKNSSSLTMHQIGEMNIEQEPQAPVLKRYRTDDATIEKLGELLIENPQGILLFRDELAGFLYSFEKQGRENDRQFFMEGWSGKDDFHVDRIARGSLYIPSLCISILGSIQPGPLMRYTQASIKGGAGDDGFIQRFQIMVWPEILGEWKLVNSTSSLDLENQVIKIFDYLDALDFDHARKPIFLEFDMEAQALFDIWQHHLENRLRSNELPAHFEAHLAKYKKLVPALALIFELLMAASKTMRASKIGVNALDMAITWSEYLETHAEKVYNSSVNRVTQSAQSLMKRISHGQLNAPFTAREVYYGKHWSGLATPEEVQEAINYLCENNQLMQQLIKTGGKPTTKYRVHPDVFNSTLYNF